MLFLSTDACENKGESQLNTNYYVKKQFSLFLYILPYIIFCNISFALRGVLEPAIQKFHIHLDIQQNALPAPVLFLYNSANFAIFVYS